MCLGLPSWEVEQGCVADLMLHCLHSTWQTEFNKCLLQLLGARSLWGLFGSLLWKIILKQGSMSEMPFFLWNSVKFSCCVDWNR